MNAKVWCSQQLPEASLCPNGCSLWWGKWLPPASMLSLWRLFGLVHRAALGGQKALGDSSFLLQPQLCYLERWELLWDWLDDVVAPLSWEKPLLQDSRLDMDPLGWNNTDLLVRQLLMKNSTHLTDQLALCNTCKGILYFVPSFSTKNLHVITTN